MIVLLFVDYRLFENDSKNTKKKKSLGSSKFIFSFVIENLKWLYSLLTNLLIGAYCTRKTLKS